MPNRPCLAVLAPLAAAALAAAALTTAAAAQSVERTDPIDEGPMIDESRTLEESVPYQPPLPHQRRDIELAVSDDFAWFAYRAPYDFGDGALTLEALADEDENWVARGVLTRYSPPVGNPQLSVGLGVYGAHFDVPGDGFLLGVPISLGARYEIPSPLPLTASASAAWAPDITTFEGGDEILDFEARLEAGIGDAAAFFVGWRKVEVEIGDAEPEIGGDFVAGVRLWL